MSWGKMNFPGFCHIIKMMYRALPVVAFVLEMRLQLDRESLFAEVLPPTKARTCQLSLAMELSGHSQAKVYRALLFNSGRMPDFYMLSGKNIFKQIAA